MQTDSVNEACTRRSLGMVPEVVVPEVGPAHGVP
jgi:hypothetical protein